MEEKERENFIRLGFLVVNNIKDGIIDLMNFEFSRTNTTFAEFLKTNQHLYYHLCHGQMQCCQCPLEGYKFPSGQPHRNLTYSKKLYQMLYQTQTPGHIYCSCGFYTHSELSIDAFDETLALYLIDGVCFPKPHIQEAIDTLVEVKIQVTEHAKNGRISDKKFHIYWSKVEKALLIMAEYCGKEKHTKQKLNDLFEQSYDPNSYIQFQNEVLEEMERFSTNKVDSNSTSNAEKLRRILQEMKDSVYSTTHPVSKDIFYSKVRFDRRGFPRVVTLQNKIIPWTRTENIIYSSEDQELEQLTEDPCVIFFFSNPIHAEIEFNDYVVTVIDNNEMGYKSDFNLDAYSKFGYSLICVLDCKAGFLTEKDRLLLNKLKGLPIPFIQNMLFVTKGIQKSLDELSKQIISEFDLSKCNDIFLRIFPINSKEISIRLSIQIENQVLQRLRCLRFQKVNPILDFEYYNKKDLGYHKLRILSQRHPLIYGFGCDKDGMYVSVKDLDGDKHTIEIYISQFRFGSIQNIPRVTIRQFKKLNIKPILVHKSGDRTEVSNMQKRHRNCEKLDDDQTECNRNTNNSVHINKTSHATAALFLSDSEGKQYFVTCAHVTMGLCGNEIDVISSNGTYHKCDKIITPSENLDFSVVGLTTNQERIQKGIRCKDSFCSGSLFERDVLTISHETKVFKWGASSGFSEGRYVETIEDSYDSVEDIGEAVEIDENGDSYQYFCIDSIGNEPFAIPGDSGSLISFEHDGVKAAFVLIGSDSENPRRFISNRLSDGLKLIKHNVPSINHYLDQKPY